MESPGPGSYRISRELETGSRMTIKQSPKAVIPTAVRNTSESFIKEGSGPVAMRFVDPKKNSAFKSTQS